MSKRGGRHSTAVLLVTANAPVVVIATVGGLAEPAWCVRATNVAVRVAVPPHNECVGADRVHDAADSEGCFVQVVRVFI